MKIAQEEIKARKEEQERKLQAGTRVYVQLVLCLCYIFWFHHGHIQGCTNYWCQVSQMTKFCMVVPKIFGPSVWSLFHVTHLANLGWLLLLENLWTPCQIYSGYLVSCTAVIIYSFLSSCKMMCVASVCVWWLAAESHPESAENLVLQWYLSYCSLGSFQLSYVHVTGCSGKQCRN